MNPNLPQMSAIPEITKPSTPNLEPGFDSRLETPKALLKRSKAAARAIRAFVNANPDQLYQKDSNQCVRVETWQFAGACFGYSAVVASTESLLNDHGEEVGFVAVVSLVNAQGRLISGAEASCMRTEEFWCKAPSFQLRSMAQTRACGKAYRNVLAFVMVLAKFSPTPAEEMGANWTEEREITTPCYECGNKVTKKRALATRKKYGKELCLECGKKTDDKATGMTKIQDASQVAEHIAQVKQRKANGGAQPIVAVLDAGQEEIAG